MRITPFRKNYPENSRLQFWNANPNPYPHHQTPFRRRRRRLLPLRQCPAAAAVATMGVKNLWDILDSCKQKLPLNHLQWVPKPSLACSRPSVFLPPPPSPADSVLSMVGGSGTRRCAWISPAGSCSSVPPIARRLSSGTRSTSRTSSTASAPSLPSIAASSSSQVSLGISLDLVLGI
jgi:hypothetical protein